jgi:RHS repeat-associated protein
MTSKTITDTATSATRVWTYAYYANSTDGSGNTILGRLKTVTGPRTDVTEVTTYAYDTNFNLNQVTNALSQVTKITAIDSSGRPTKIVDPNSVETDLTYDTNGRLQTAVRAVGTSLAATTTFGYDSVGNLTKVTLPNSVYVSYSYDNAHRLTGVTDVLGNTITYTLDATGNVTQKVIKNTVPTTVYTHTATFDELARLLTSVGASSQTAKYAYDLDSNLTSYTDPNTNATAYAFDVLNRLNKRTDALSGVTTPGYDANSNLTSMKDQRSNSTTYTYNAFGDITGETSPDRGTLTYTVDKEGNVTQRTDARSVVTNYTYDALNRLATVAYPSASSLNVTLTYDSTTGCGTAGIGRLCSVTDAAGTTAYQYDLLGRVTQEKDTRGSNNLTTSYSYDLAGTLTGITLPSGRTVTYTLDSDGRVSSVSATVNVTATTLASSITYLPFGPITGLTYGNSLTFSASFDQDYNPTARSVSGSIYSWTYATDSNGNIKQAGTTTYGFDALNRANTENPGTSVSYTYDATSNRLTKGSTSTTVPSTSNKISAVGGTSYTYDAAGDITAIGTNGYSWSAAGLMATSTASGTTVGTYTYDMYTRRTEKVAASTTYYVYGLDGTLYGEYNSSGALIREYIYLNGAPLAQVDAGTPEVLTYIHTDHLGAPRFATNTSGSSVWSWTNDAFGISTPSGTATINLRMPGQYYDSESGLFYNINRTYNPAIGRLMSSDPISIDGGLNTFLYGRANPVNRVDPSGLDDINYLPWMQNRVTDAKQSASSMISQRAEFSAQSPQGVFSVAAHGGIDPATGNYALFDEKGNAISPEQLAKIINSDKRYTPGETVLLDACNPSQAGNDYAAAVARIMGSPVILPSDVIFGHHAGNESFGVHRPLSPIVGVNEDGHWLKFYPNGAWESNASYPSLEATQ